ncbi:MAG: biopolymer transporter ExbD [Bacteroidota bacterium]
MAELNQSPANSGGGAKPRKKMSTRVDLTAMVDLAFLLVTFFMLTTTLTKPKAMLLTMPDNTVDPPGQAASRTVTLCLGKGNQLVYYRGLIEKPIGNPQVVGYRKTGLRQALVTTAQKIKQETGKNMMVIIKPGIHSLYDNVVNTIDELNITHTLTYAVADITPKDNDLLKQKSIF